MKSQHGKVTIYTAGFGITKIEAKECEVETEVSYAQYKNAIRYRYKEPRQRKARGGTQTSHPSLVILEGWGHLDPDDPMTAPKREGVFEVTRSRHSICSPEYGNEFGVKLEAYLEANPNVKVLHDFRNHNTISPARVA